MDIYFFLMTHLSEIFWVCAIVFLICSILSVKDYIQNNHHTKNFVNKCVECTATIIQPVVMNISNKDTAISVALAVFSGFQIIRIKSSEYTTSEVLFHVNGEKIQTMISRKRSFRNPKFGDEIEICYDPDNPELSFAKDIKKTILNKKIEECIFNVFLTIMCVVFAVGAKNTFL